MSVAGVDARKKTGFSSFCASHSRSYGARQSSIISETRVVRLDERSSVILVGKPIAQTLESNIELVLARQLPRADAFDHLPRLINSLRGMRQKVEDRLDIQGDWRGRLTTEVDEMTSKLEKYWKSGEDDEDYYEQDDYCRGADYYWEQHEDCDY